MFFKYLLTLLVFFSTCSYCLDKEEIRDLCREAEKCFEQGNELAGTNHDGAVEAWRKSAARYERVYREGGIANGPLFYNLGNVYFSLGDMGRAILNYRRAQRFSPNDTNLLRNLAFARRNCQDNVQEQESRKVLKTIFFLHYDFSLATREILFTVFFCLFCLAGIACLYCRQSWLSYTRWSLLLLALVVAVSVAVSEFSFRKYHPGVILATEVEGRKGNSDTYGKSFQEPLHAGTEFTLLERRGNWLEIQLNDGQTCWLPAEAADLL